MTNLPDAAPSEDDREALIDVVKRNRSVVKRMSDGYPSVVFVTDETIADAILAAGFSRAAAPDAATEASGSSKTLADEYLELLHDLQTKYVKDTDILFLARKKAEAERDAALAAIERVRVAHRRYTYYELEDSCPDMTDEHREEHHHESYEIGEFYCDQMPTGDVVCDMCRDADGERMAWPCPTVAALDGAPEPEWEWGYRGETLIDVHSQKSRESAEGAVKDLTEYWALHGKKFEVVRRRKAGPWLPVEGEKP